MSRQTPRRIDNLLLQLGAEAAGVTLDPDLSSLTYNVEDLQLYLPSRRTRTALSLYSVPTDVARRSIVEVVGVASGGTWVEHVANRTAAQVLMHMTDPTTGTSITNNLTDGLEFAATTFFDEVFLSGLFPISGDVLPWSKQTPELSIVGQGTTSLVPVVPFFFLLTQDRPFPATPFWIPPNWRLALTGFGPNQQITVDLVLTLPPLGVTT